MSEIGAAQFKAHCLRVMDQVRRTRQEVVITKRGVPVAKLVPPDPPQSQDIFGCLAAEMTIEGDLDAALQTAEEWQAIDRERDKQRSGWDREWTASGTISGRKGATPNRRRPKQARSQETPASGRRASR